MVPSCAMAAAEKKSTAAKVHALARLLNLLVMKWWLLIRF